MCCRLICDARNEERVSAASAVEWALACDVCWRIEIQTRLLNKLHIYILR